MNHSRLLQIMNHFSKWVKTATNQVVQMKSIPLIYKPKFLSNDLSKFQTHKALADSVDSEPKNNNYLKSKFDEIVVWYEQISGMDEVRIAQKRVIDAQDRLILAQERRREASKQLALIHNKLKEVYSDLDTTTRGEESTEPVLTSSASQSTGIIDSSISLTSAPNVEPDPLPCTSRYLQLITKEHNFLKEEKRYLEEFNLCEQEERNSFTVLSSTVKDSHEKERAQAERTKYWSLIGSIIGTVIGVVGSSVNNEFKMRELRKMIKETAANRASSSDLDIETSSLLSKLEKQLSAIANNISSSHNQKNNQVGQLLHSLTNSSTNTKMEELEAFLQQQRYETKVVIVAATVLGVIIPIVVSLVNR